jgi:hypothetical protein
VITINDDDDNTNNNSSFFQTLKLHGPIDRLYDGDDMSVMAAIILLTLIKIIL